MKKFTLLLLSVSQLTWSMHDTAPQPLEMVKNYTIEKTKRTVSHCSNLSKEVSDFCCCCGCTDSYSIQFLKDHHDGSKLTCNGDFPSCLCHSYMKETDTARPCDPIMCCITGNMAYGMGCIVCPVETSIGTCVGLSLLAAIRQRFYCVKNEMEQKSE